MAEQGKRRFLRSSTSPGGSSKTMGSPTASNTSGGGGDGPELRRTTSALARFTRSVSKIGSRRRRGGSELPAAIVNEQDEYESDALAKHTQHSYETPIRRAETVPTRVGFNDSHIRGTVTVIDAAAFLRAVPDMLGVDASLSTVSAAVRNAENLARTLRVSAADVDTTTRNTAIRTTTTTKTTFSGSIRNAESAKEDAFKILEANRQWERLHDAFEAALAEHRFEAAFNYWQELNALVGTTPATTTAVTNAVAASERTWILENKCSECASLLVSSLQHQIRLSTPGGGGGEGGAANSQQLVMLLCQLAGLPAALATLLDASRARLRDHLESLPLGYQRAAAAGSGAAAEEASNDLAGALGQSLASAIGATIKLVKSIINSRNSNGEKSSTRDIAITYGSLCDWIVAEVSFACEVLRKSVIVPRAAPAGLATTTRCAAAFLVHCDGLDTSIDIPVGQLARESVWPAVEPVVQRRARQVCDGLRKAAIIEATKAASNTTSKLPSTRNGNASWEELVSVFPSAKRLATEVSGIAAAVAPIAGPLAVSSVRSTVTAAFMAFAESVSAALAAPATSGQKASSLVAEISMEIATLLVERVLAESTSALSQAAWGPAVDAAAMVAALEEMAKTLGMDTVVE